MLAKKRLQQLLHQRNIVDLYPVLERHAMQAPEEMIRVAYEVPLGLAVFSPYYCANRWPMTELQIFHERANRNEMVLLPLFFQVRPPAIFVGGQ